MRKSECEKKNAIVGIQANVGKSGLLGDTNYKCDNRHENKVVTVQNRDTEGITCVRLMCWLVLLASEGRASGGFETGVPDDIECVIRKEHLHVGGMEGTGHLVVNSLLR